jgi:hypothetical protein
MVFGAFDGILPNNCKFSLVQCQILARQGKEQNLQKYRGRMFDCLGKERRITKILILKLINHSKIVKIKKESCLNAQHSYLNGTQDMIVFC